MTTSTSDAAAKGAKSTTTADDTLKEKSRDASVISGGHLVAKALGDHMLVTPTSPERAPVTPITRTG